MFRSNNCLFWFCLLFVFVLASCTSKVHYANFSKTNSHNQAKASSQEVASIQQKEISDVPNIPQYPVSTITVSTPSKNHPSAFKKTRIANSLLQPDLKSAAQEIKKSLTGKWYMLADEDPPKRKIPTVVYIGLSLAILSVASIMGGLIIAWFFASMFGFFTSLAAIDFVYRHKDKYKGAGFAIFGMLLSLVSLLSIGFLLLALSGWS